MQHFHFRFDPRYERLLGLLRITPATSGVDIGDGRFIARFGPWTVNTDLDNVAEVEVTGGYKAWRAIGVRRSLADGGLTFATNVDRGACVHFLEPVKGIDPLGLLKHPGLTVTVGDVEGLRQALGTTG